MAIYITKMNGEREEFRQEKLLRSLKRSGASHNMRQEILRKITQKLYDGITTKEIYEHAFDLLKKMRTHHPIAARYSIKRAVLDLGPSGFPFERFIAEIFRHLGYKHVRTGMQMHGRCAPHEVDLLAMYKSIRVGAEIKFHNALGIKTDLKVALYVKARFEDLADKIDQGWLITNTRFTSNAIAYGRCNNMRMLGWNYPPGRGIESLIDRANVHPITALTTLKNSQKRLLLQNDIVLIQTLLDNSALLKAHGVSKQMIPAVLKEAKQMCSFGIKHMPHIKQTIDFD